LMTGALGQDERLELHLVTQETGGISTQILAAMETKDEAGLAPGAPLIIWEKDYEAAKNRFICL